MLALRTAPLGHEAGVGAGQGVVRVIHGRRPPVRPAHDQSPVRPQHPVGLAQHGGRISDMLQDAVGTGPIRTGIRQRQCVEAIMPQLDTRPAGRTGQGGRNHRARSAVGVTDRATRAARRAGMAPRGGACCDSGRMDSSHFRITRVRLRHFRTLAGADVRLGGLVFLVGPNGSGKSNFLDALGLVSQGVGSSLEGALRERGGVAQVRRRAPGRPDRFLVALSFEGPGLSGGYEIQVAGARGGGFRVVREACEAEYGGRRAAFRVADGEVAMATERRLPGADSGQLLLSRLGRHGVFGAVHEGLARARVYDPEPRAMRVPGPAGDGRALLPDAANAAAVLHRMGRSACGAADRRRLESYLREIVPGLAGVRCRAAGGAETVEFGQVVAGAAHPWRFTAASVSDGTLRALAVLLALFAPAAGGFGVVAVEEPEAALHPAAVAVLGRALRDAAGRRQVLVTTHSPELLDDEDLAADEVRAVRCAAGVTTVGEPAEPAAFALRAGLETAGALLRGGELVPGPVTVNPAADEAGRERHGRAAPRTRGAAVGG
jgi:predicted ATPase